MLDLLRKNIRSVGELVVGGGLLFSLTSVYFNSRTLAIDSAKWEQERQRNLIDTSQAVLNLAASMCIPGDIDKTRRNIKILNEVGNTLITEKICYLYDDASVSYDNFARPSPGTILRGYGLRMNPILNTYMLNTGMDYDEDKGKTVCAAESGTVLFSGEAPGLGQNIVIRHSNSTVSRYTHLAQSDVKSGDFVDRGQQIGEMGDTGISSSVHLNFEILVNDENVDPQKLIRDDDFVCPQAPLQ